MSEHPNSTAPRARRRSKLPFILLGIFVILVAGGTAAWFLFLKGDAQKPLSITDCKAKETGSPIDAGTLDGTWKVVPGTSGCTTTAGYRVKEVFTVGNRHVTANGRTPSVTGSVTVAGGKVTKGSFVVAVNTLRSDEDMRDQTIHHQGLETDRFPTATFAIDRPVTLPAITEGKAFDIPVRGSLTLHGVTKAIAITLHVKVTGPQVTVQGAAPITMSDYSITPPSRDGFVRVAGDGSFEFLVSLRK